MIASYKPMISGNSEPLFNRMMFYSVLFHLKKVFTLLLSWEPLFHVQTKKFWLRI